MRKNDTSNRADPHAGHNHDHSGHAHAPGKGHAHGHAHSRNADQKRLWIALGLTATIAVAEGVGGYLTNSMALLSDAIHMLTDVSALGLTLLALWFAARPANSKKTYGYYRLEILSALANGVLLLLMTSWVCVEASARFRHPQHIVLPTMLGIASIGLASNLGSLYFLHRSDSLGVRSAFLHILGDTLSSIGVIVAALVMWKTGWLWLDPAVSIGISVIIVLSSYRLLKEAVDVLLESVPAHVDVPYIRDLMVRVPGVVAVHDLHVWTISSGLYALSAHLVVLDPMVCNNDTILSAVKHELFDRYGIDHTTIQIESETYAHLGEVH